MKNCLYLPQSKKIIATYTKNEIYIEGLLYARYSNSVVYLLSNDKIIGKLYSNQTRGVLVSSPNIYFDTLGNDIYFTEIKNPKLDFTSIASYDKNALGAIAAYIAYKHYMTNAQNNVHYVPYEEQSDDLPKKEYSTPRYEPQIAKDTKINEPELKNPLNESKKESINIPSFAPNPPSSGFFVIVVIIIAFAYVLINLIPENWHNLAHMGEEGYEGMEVAFYVSVFSAIISIIVAAFSKFDAFSNGLSAYSICLKIGLVITVIYLIKSGNVFFNFPILNFLGTVLAAILGICIYAVPIFIVLLIILAIISAIKK